MDGAGDVANFFVARQNLVSFGGQLRAVILQAQASKGFGHLAKSANARNHLLSDVAALRVTNGSRRDARFRREIGFIHVLAEPRNSRFNTGDFECLPATEPSPVVPENGGRLCGWQAL